MHKRSAQDPCACERSEHASASEASALVRAKRARESRRASLFVHMRRTNTWHFLQQSGQFLRLSGRPPLRYGLGPTASRSAHFVEGNATCWSDACENAGCSPALTCSLRSHRPVPPWPLVGAFGASLAQTHTHTQTSRVESSRIEMKAEGTGQVHNRVQKLVVFKFLF